MDALDSIVPGQPITEEQRAALAKSNAEESATALRLAAEHRAREGNEPPLMAAIADSVLEKLKALPKEEPEEVV